MAGQVNIQLHVLEDALKLKKEELIAIEQLTSSQMELLQKDAPHDVLMQLSAEKQQHINQVLLMDEGFVATFDRIKGTLNAQPILYQEEIKRIKLLIKEIGELDIAIQVGEKRNETQLNIRLQQGGQKNNIPRMSQNAITSYYSQMKQKPASKPGTFDQTK